MFYITDYITDRKNNLWSKLEKKIGMDKTQLRKMMFNKINFNNWLNQQYAS